MQALLTTLESSALSAGLRASAWLYPLINTLHIVGIALLVGPILILDTRLLRGQVAPAVSMLASTLLPTVRLGFGLVMLSGLLLFAARPLDYAFNTLFQFKLGCIVLALANVAWLHQSTSWGQAMGQNQPDGRVRLACGLSLSLWLSALVLGRLIGYR